MPFNQPPTPKKFGPSIRDPESVFERETRRVTQNFDKTTTLNGVLIKNVVLTTNTTRVPHQLGRPFVGFHVVDNTGNFVVFRDASDVNRPQDAIPLKASGACTVNLWVF